jgi:hypothetical protein
MFLFIAFISEFQVNFFINFRIFSTSSLKFNNTYSFIFCSLPD